MDGKTYEVKTLEDLLNVVNVENVDRLADDVRIWLKDYAMMVSLARALCPDAGTKNTDYMEAGFEWTDDGKNEITNTCISIIKKDNE